MGLDMNLSGTVFHVSASRKTVEGFELAEERFVLGYWHKHPNLHGYIVEEFADGVDDCHAISLSVENIHQIIAAIRDGDLPETTGFFFGESYGTEEERDSDIKIFTEALEWLKRETREAWRWISYRASW